MSSRDATRVNELEKSEALIDRQDHHLEARDTLCQRCCIVLRPFAIVFGIVLILVALLVFLSLLLSK